MREAMVAAAAVCVLAALCEQVVDRSRYFGALRVVLGLQIVYGFVALIRDAVQA